jgi:hypothetical protein
MILSVRVPNAKIKLKLQNRSQVMNEYDRNFIEGRSILHRRNQTQEGASGPASPECARGSTHQKLKSSWSDRKARGGVTDHRPLARRNSAATYLKIVFV